MNSLFSAFPVLVPCWNGSVVRSRIRPETAECTRYQVIVAENSQKRKKKRRKKQKENAISAEDCLFLVRHNINDNSLVNTVTSTTYPYAQQGEYAANKTILLLSRGDYNGCTRAATGRIAHGIRWRSAAARDRSWETTTAAILRNGRV